MIEDPERPDLVLLDFKNPSPPILLTAGTSELDGEGKQVRSFGSMVYRVINRPLTKWTSYEYSGSILPSWETGMLEWLSPPLGDTQHFRGECGSSAVCRALPF